MKKVISVFLAVILALSTFAFGTTVSFADEQNDFYYEDDYSTPDQSVIKQIRIIPRLMLTAITITVF